MKYTPDGRLVVDIVVPGLLVRVIGERQLCIRDPSTPQAWISAEDPVDLHSHR